MKADNELVAEALTGTRPAFAELVRRYQKPLLRLALRFTRDAVAAEDVVQECFIKAYNKLNLFEGRASFKSWLYQIAINTAKNRMRKPSAEVVNLADVEMADHSSSEAKLLKCALEDRLAKEVDALPPRQRTALWLRIFEDLSFKEIAEIMACPYDTAKANYRHALLALRHRMEDDPEWKSWNEWTDINSSAHLEGVRSITLEVES